MDFSPAVETWSADDDERPRRFRRTGPLSFRAAFASTVGVLILLCASLVAVTQGRGPELSSTQVDTASVTTAPNQQLRLFVDESVAHVRASQVRVVPRVPFEVQTAGTTVTLQFTQRLRSATRYSVAISGVTSVFGSHAASLATSFTTARAAILTLDRDPSATDSIVRSSVGTPGRTVAYRAARIQAFGAIGSDLVVVTDDTRSSTIRIVSARGLTEDLILPGPGLVRAFALDAPTGLVAFTWTPASAPRATPRLFTIDLQGQHTSTAVTGAAARAARALLARGGSVGSQVRTSEGDVQIAADGRSVTIRPSAGSRPTPLVRALAGQRFSALTASPNGQYVSVVSSPAEARSDGYTLAPAPRGPTTLVVDASTGATVGTFAGASLTW